ncbi:hypothetical protein [Nocardia wallacei]|uniref:hypothetical protein n=1 Tax=Nocardia wallacei TaxID=480035 RepID=UPI00245743FB|nr:hypothetical protein [Nocardia wallacei]
MPYFYEYTGGDQDLVVESDEPRPDLLEWAYFRQVDAPAIAPAKAEPKADPEPEPEQDSEPVEEAKPAPRARKPRTPKAAE